MTIDLAAIRKANEEIAKDLTKPNEGGGDYQPPAAGPTRLRFVGYVETGTHTSEWQGTKKVQKKAKLFFELSGPKHQPAEFDGRKVPHVVVIDVAVSTHVKSGYIKLFKLMSGPYAGTTNFLDLLGNAYRGTLVHRKYKRRDGKEGVAAELKNDAGYTISGTEFEDPESGELRKVVVDEPITPLKVFVWDIADISQWESIFVDGTYDDGNTKNKLQDLIKRAEDFHGSPIFEALVAAGRDAELEPATLTSQAPADAADEGGQAASAPAVAQAALAADEGDDPLAGVK